MSGEYAAVLTHIPESVGGSFGGKTFHTPFTGDHAGQRAHDFMAGEKARGDFEGSLWTMVCNDAARDRLTDDRMVLLGFDSDFDTTETTKNGGDDAV